MKYSMIGLLVLGLIAALSAAVLLAVIKAPQRNASGQSAEVVALIANHDMPSVTVVTEAMITETAIAQAEAPKGLLTSPLQALGRPLTRPVVKGQPLTADCFASSRRGIDLVAALEEGKRAVTVELALAAGLEGLLYPGSVVDVLATFDVDRRGTNGENVAVATTLLHGVEVLAIDIETVKTDADGQAKEVEAGALRKTRRVTLLVDSDQAKALQLAAEHGSVSLAMRNPLDKTEPGEEPTLLSGGRLARLAEYLEASVPHPGAAAKTTDPAGEAPASAANRGAARQWDVTILRGTAVEVRSMSRGDGAEPKLAADQR